MHERVNNIDSAKKNVPAETTHVFLQHTNLSTYIYEVFATIWKKLDMESRSVPDFYSGYIAQCCYGCQYFATLFNLMVELRLITG